MIALHKAKRATMIMFLICGTALSSWAPMVPLAKDRLRLQESELGLLLLLLGAGAIAMMPITGFLIGKLGSRIIIAAGALLTSLTLPTLLIAPNYTSMAIALFLFGCGIGTVDVAMNTHGVHVQNRYGRPIMSSLHGLFSVGGLIGSLCLGFLIKFGLNPLIAALGISAVLLLLTISQYNALFSARTENENSVKAATTAQEPGSTASAWLDLRVLFLGFLCFCVFLSEGAMLDWSAIFLRDVKHIPIAYAGAGYASFSVAMAIMRLLGDKIVEKINGRTIVVGGAIIAAAGLAIAIQSESIALVLVGYSLLGIGAANIIPILFSEGGLIQGVSPTIAIAAISTMGYAGQLAGPALLGFVAQQYTLPIAFGLVAALMLLVGIGYWMKKMLSKNT